MKIDHAGTTPGLVGQATEQKTVNMRCKNPDCDCIQAIEVVLPVASLSRTYRCVKCHRTWGITVGGSVNL